MPAATGAGDDTCTLCGRELDGSSVEDGDAGTFCSTGCLEVHEALGDDGEDAIEAMSGADGTEDRDGTIATYLRVDGMYSATCEAYLEARASAVDGVVAAEASYVTETIRVDHDPDAVSAEALRETLSTLGYTAHLRASAAAVADDPAQRTRRSRETAGQRRDRDEAFLELRYVMAVVFGSFLLIPYVAIVYPVHLATFVDWPVLQPFQEGFEFGSAGGFLFLRIYLVLTGLIILVTGLPVLRGAYISLRMRRPNTNLLVAITVVSAYLYSIAAVLLNRNDVFFDVAVVVAAAIAAAMLYEGSVKQRALARLTDLTVAQVDTASVLEGDAPREVAVEELAPDDRVLVRAGERVPVDGVLETGRCTVDESVVTGESLPVRKRAGDAVIGGSVVTDDAAIIRVDPDTDSTIDRITTAVWALQSADHGIQRRADRLATWAVGPLVALAAVVAVGAYAVGQEAPTAVRSSVLVLLVASPWALGLATPLSVATALEAALERGIVILDDTIFDRLRDVDVVVFDKTGTLTTGEMEVLETDASPDLLAAAAALERRATHPAARAVVAAFGDTEAEAGPQHTDGGASSEPGAVTDFTTHRSGVGGEVGGRRTMVGDLDLFEDRGWTISDDVRTRVASAREAGRLPVVVGQDGTAEGVIVVGDEPRGGWEAIFERLAERGIDVVVLTGDDAEATARFGRQAAVTHAFANVPPEGKTATIRRLRASGRVAMVGDGTNDAPALAAADLGISLGSGTDLAADAADVAIADDDVAAVSTAFDLARAARRRVRQNVGLALVYNAIAISALALGGFNPLVAISGLLATGALLVGNSRRALLRSGT